MIDVTDQYLKGLPALPDGWSWYIRRDVVDGWTKVIIYLRDELLHARGHGTIDVTMYGDGIAVLERAHGIAKAAGL